jgi:hypothetical protein
MKKSANKTIERINPYQIKIDNQDYIMNFKHVSIEILSCKFIDYFLFSEDFEDTVEAPYYTHQEIINFEPKYLRNDNYDWKEISQMIKIRKETVKSSRLVGKALLLDGDQFIGFDINKQQVDVGHFNEIEINIGSCKEKKISVLFEYDEKLNIEAFIPLENMIQIKDELQRNTESIIRVHFNVLCYTNRMSDSFREATAPREFYYDKINDPIAYLDSVQVIKNANNKAEKIETKINSFEKTESKIIQHQNDLNDGNDSNMENLLRKLKFTNYLCCFAVFMSLCTLLVK